MSIIVKVVSKMVKVVSRTFGHLGGEGVVCEVGYGYIAGGRGGVHDGEDDIVMVRVMSMMLDVISDSRGGVHDGGGKRVGVWGGEDDPFARGGRGGDVETRV